MAPAGDIKHVPHTHASNRALTAMAAIPGSEKPAALNGVKVEGHFDYGCQVVGFKEGVSAAATAAIGGLADALVLPDDSAQRIEALQDDEVQVGDAEGNRSCAYLAAARHAQIVREYCVMHRRRVVVLAWAGSAGSDLYGFLTTWAIVRKTSEPKAVATQQHYLKRAPKGSEKLENLVFLGYRGCSIDRVKKAGKKGENYVFTPPQKGTGGAAVLGNGIYLTDNWRVAYHEFAVPAGQAAFEKRARKKVDPDTFAASEDAPRYAKLFAVFMNAATFKGKSNGACYACDPDHYARRGEYHLEGVPAATVEAYMGQEIRKRIDACENGVDGTNALWVESLFQTELQRKVKDAALGSLCVRVVEVPQNAGDLPSLPEADGDGGGVALAEKYDETIDLSEWLRD